MGADRQDPVPDILLERYLAGDLSSEQRQMIEAQRDASEEVRSRLANLECQKDAFLAADPPEQFAHRLSTRLAVKGAAAPRGRRWWAWILAPSATAAAAVLVTVAFVSMREEAPSGLVAPLAKEEKSEVAASEQEDAPVLAAQDADTTTVRAPRGSTPKGGTSSRSMARPPSRSKTEVDGALGSADAPLAAAPRSALARRSAREPAPPAKRKLEPMPMEFFAEPEPMAAPSAGAVRTAAPHPRAQSPAVPPAADEAPAAAMPPAAAPAEEPKEHPVELLAQAEPAAEPPVANASKAKPSRRPPDEPSAREPPAEAKAKAPPEPVMDLLTRESVAGSADDAAGHAKERAAAKPVTRPRPKKGRGSAQPALAPQDGLRDRPAPRAKKASRRRETLTPRDVMDAIRSNVHTLAPCAEAATGLGPGKHTLILDLRIKPNGSVTAVKVRMPEPAEVALIRCVKQKVRKWRFPKSQKGAPVKNLRLPFTIE